MTFGATDVAATLINDWGYPRDVALREFLYPSAAALTVSARSVGST
jgi:hypothetical protein